MVIFHVKCYSPLRHRFEIKVIRIDRDTAESLNERDLWHKVIDRFYSNYVVKECLFLVSIEAVEGKWE